MKQVFEVNTVTEGHLSTYDVRDALHDRCNTVGVWVKDVTTEPAEEEPAMNKRIFEVETQAPYILGSQTVKACLEDANLGMHVSVKDVSKDVAILRGQEPKPEGWPAPEMIEVERSHHENLQDQLLLLHDEIAKLRISNSELQAEIGVCETVIEDRNRCRNEAKERAKSSILLSEVIAMWDEIHITNIGDFGFCDLCNAFESQGITIKNDISGVAP